MPLTRKLARYEPPGSNIGSVITCDPVDVDPNSPDTDAVTFPPSSSLPVFLTTNDMTALPLVNGFSGSLWLTRRSSTLNWGRRQCGVAGGQEIRVMTLTPTCCTRCSLAWP